ncbi:MAG: glycosyltransferase, partial [Bacteroidota bacterium]
MRIICTVTNDLSHDQRMDRVCTSLQAAGHDVILVGRLRKNSGPLPHKSYEQYRYPVKYDAGKRFYLSYNFQLWQALRHWDYDAVCSVDLDTLWAGVRLTRGQDKKLVFDAHEWFSETPEVVNRSLVRSFWQRVGKWGAPKADLCYTVAPMLAEKLRQEYGVPFSTVRNLPLRSELPFSAPAAAPRIILYQGMLNPGRGLETAITAMRDLPEHELWLVGSGPEEGALRRCQERTQTQDRVRFLGFRPPAELPEITRQAWLGLNLLDAVSPSYYYSLANKALDYVQAGLPSVQMDFPEYRAINERYSCYRLLPELDAGKLVGIVRELDAPRAYLGLREGCATAAADLCWEKE